MKKILFSILAAAVVTASCTKFVEDAPIVFIDAESPEVTAETSGDEQIFITVTGKQSTSFFSYAVIEGPAAKLDSVSLLKGSYASNAIKLDGNPVAGVVDFSEEQTVSIKLDKLTPNTTYTVYAVASNAQGKVSSVATASTTTTDATAPQLIYDDYEDMEKDGVLAFAIPFDDPVKLGANPEVTAHFFARYEGETSDTYYILTEQKSVNIPSASLVTDGNVLYVFVPEEEYIPGAYVSITYTEGTVENYLGAKCAAFEKATVAYSSTDRQVIYNGICSRYATTTFALSLNEEGDADDSDDDTQDKVDDDDEEDEDEKKYEIFSDWKTLVMKSYAQTEYPLAVKQKTTVAISVVDGDGRTVSYTGTQFGILNKAEGIVGVALDEDPGFGTYISYTIAEESLIDIYGNTNEEFKIEDGYFCSYGYTLDDIIGTYEVSSYNAITGTKSPVYSLVIEESDDKEKGNIVITNYLDIEGKLYATFDVDNGVFSIKAYEIFSGDDTEGYCTYFYKSAEAVFSVPVAGTITSNNYIGAAIIVNGDLDDYATDSAGNVLLLYYFTAKRQ